MGSKVSSVGGGGERRRERSESHDENNTSPPPPPTLVHLPPRQRSSSTSPQLHSSDWIRNRLLSNLTLKCPICSKSLNSDDVEVHLVMCLTRPRINYNEDILTVNSGECAICLEEMEEGDKIARLPCLCIYHKKCIDAWWKVNRVCPEHPDH